MQSESEAKVIAEGLMALAVVSAKRWLHSNGTVIADARRLANLLHEEMSRTMRNSMAGDGTLHPIHASMLLEVEAGLAGVEAARRYAEAVRS